MLRLKISIYPILPALQECILAFFRVKQADTASDVSLTVVDSLFAFNQAVAASSTLVDNGMCVIIVRILEEEELMSNQIHL